MSIDFYFNEVAPGFYPSLSVEQADAFLKLLQGMEQTLENAYKEVKDEASRAKLETVSDIILGRLGGMGFVLRDEYPDLSAFFKASNATQRAMGLLEELKVKLESE